MSMAAAKNPTALRSARVQESLVCDFDMRYLQAQAVDPHKLRDVLEHAPATFGSRRDGGNPTLVSYAAAFDAARDHQPVPGSRQQARLRRRKRHAHRFNALGLEFLNQV
jgi:hypothetical protein